MQDMTKDRPVVLITGSASGIGRATATTFSTAGYRTALVDRDEAGLSETLQQLRTQGSQGWATTCDVSDPASVEAAHLAAFPAFGRLDAAVNAAGIEGAWRKLADESLDLFDRVISVNLRGVWSCMQHQIRQMLTQEKGGIIVNVASGAGLVGSARSAVYAASKHGVVGLTKSAALQYATSGIRINAVCAGGVETPMADRILEQMPPNSLMSGRSVTPLGRYSTPVEIAAAALWLCSDLAASVIGVALPIDGGRTAA
jgi:NAD(P)-dependent dehydrogenase (short-subunit alcohol dehydrogenase family)